MLDKNIDIGDRVCFCSDDGPGFGTVRNYEDEIYEIMYANYIGHPGRSNFAIVMDYVAPIPKGKNIPKYKIGDTIEFSGYRIDSGPGSSCGKGFVLDITRDIPVFPAPFYNVYILTDIVYNVNTLNWNLYEIYIREDEIIE